MISRGKEGESRIIDFRDDVALESGSMRIRESTYNCWFRKVHIINGSGSGRGGEVNSV